MRRGWLAIGTGLAITGILAALMYTRITHPAPNGQETVSLAIVHPSLLILSTPGIAFMWLIVCLTPINLNFHPALAPSLAAVGNAIFYSLAAYVVLRMSAKWRRT